VWTLAFNLTDNLLLFFAVAVVIEEDMKDIIRDLMAAFAK